MRLQGGSKYASGGKRVYAVMVWRQDGRSEAGNPRIRAFVKAFAVDNREQVTAIDDIDDAIWSAVAQKVGVAEIGSDSEHQYESGLLDKKEHEEREKRERVERQIQVAADQASQRDEEARKLESEKQRTKPPCVDVSVNGLIASSPADVEALHASQLSSSRLEDILARHPYSCRINQFGVAYGCQGAAYINDRKAKITDWTKDHYVIAVPLDFQIGRKDAPAIVRRSDVRCLR